MNEQERIEFNRQIAEELGYQISGIWLIAPNGAQLVDVDRVHPDLVWGIVFQQKLIPDWATDLNAAVTLPHPKALFILSISQTGMATATYYLSSGDHHSRTHESPAIAMCLAWLEFYPVMKILSESTQQGNRK